MLFHKASFTQGSLTQRLLHREAFAQISLYTHTHTFAHRSLHTHRCVFTKTQFFQEAFACNAFTNWSFCTEDPLHKAAFKQIVFAHRAFHTEQHLHTNVVTHTEPFTRSFVSHREAFAQRKLFAHNCFYTQKKYP